MTAGNPYAPCGAWRILAAASLVAWCVFAAPQTPPPAAPPEPVPAPSIGIRKIVKPCEFCAGSREGRGKLKILPPDLGQHKGSIRPKDHWAVRMACPICKGKGRRTVFRTMMMPPLPEDVPPCRACGWTGVERCRKCNASGMVKCDGRECRDGWIVRRKETGGGKGPRHASMAVDPCPVCGGAGKILCPVCRGMEGLPCRTCSGTGKKVR